MQLNVVIQTTRPPFLLLTPVCIFLGFSTAYTSSTSINTVDTFLVLLGALLAHISVNTFNEFFDFKSGLDFHTSKTAFSGGSGALPSHPEMAKYTLFIGVMSLVIVSVIGLYFIATKGTQILPIGLLGILLVITYTQWLNRLPLTCLIAPGLGFGVLMVVGTHIVLAESITSLPWLVSVIPFFLLNNLLLLNQYPDTKADADIGRKTVPIVFGFSKSNLIYAVFMASAYAWIVVLVNKDYLPDLSLIALLPILLSLFSLMGAIKHSSHLRVTPKFMAANVMASLLTPLLLAISILVG